MSWDVALISAGAGLLAGAIGSLVAPWVHWAIEKRRSQFMYRQELVRTWRVEIESFSWDHGDFGDSTTYAAMRPHMREEVIKKFEAQRTMHVPPDGGRGQKLHKQWASDEVARIEKEWGLV
ncbi:hypothetical protein [Halomonas salina]|uniref:Minor tail protein n=1 Tax=Halomonas salina TaxID=42565 RepID=A0ABR4WTZ5_9GAMM|nr:hypothetical protein [Halomonas salina]KGE78191.1 hypothetical protein FP66_04935 [Halomonas salina]